MGFFFFKEGTAAYALVDKLRNILIDFSKPKSITPEIFVMNTEILNFESRDLFLS